jgi:ABC-type nitrate/sulfonate/bicarbonate transport system substrate-binding protein
MVDPAQPCRNSIELSRNFYRWTAFFMAVTIFVCCACSREGGSEKAEEVRIGVPPLEQNALIYIAEHERFFAKNGLRVVVKNYDTGVATIEAALKGQVDIAGTAEFPFVRAVLAGEDVLIIACEDKFENDYLLGLKDRGITRVSDLKGKKIGVAIGTITEFYLGRFLALNGISIRAVTRVDLSPDQYISAVAKRGVDAIITWQPYVHRILRDVGGVTVWKAQSSQAVFGVMACGRRWVEKHANTIKLLLKSLQAAEDFLIRHPDKSKAIIKKHLNYDDAYVEQIWPNHTFSLSLDQTLVLAMKDEAQWLINNELTDKTTIPDFADYIYADGLLAVEPYAVDIIR